MQRLTRDKAHHLLRRAFGCLKGRRRAASENFLAPCTMPHAEGWALRLCRSCCPCPGTGLLQTRPHTHVTRSVTGVSIASPTSLPVDIQKPRTQLSETTKTWRRAGSLVRHVVRHQGPQRGQRFTCSTDLLLSTPEVLQNASPHLTHPLPLLSHSFSTQNRTLLSSFSSSI